MLCEFAKPDFGQTECDAVARVLSGSWLAAGPENEAFEQEFAEYVGSKYAVCVNSGSSGNLLALASLNLPKGSRVLTSACGFPATLAPILHLGLEPVLVDYDITTLNIDRRQAVEHLFKVDAIILAHTLGNPVEMGSLQAFHAAGVPLIEDCCEAVGTWVDTQSVGTFGTFGTFSFYPSHQITALGGGGMVVTDSPSLARRMKSLRDWGKVITDGYVQGETLTTYAGGYYPGYTYETVGFNFKLPDANAAFGREQLKRLSGFVQARRLNYEYLWAALWNVNWLHPAPVAHKDTSWFGYPLVLREGNRDSFGTYLEAHDIRHRPFFAGNILRHKPFQHLGQAEDFPVADYLMRNACFVGVWQGLTTDHLDYMVETIRAWTPTT